MASRSEKFHIPSQPGMEWYKNLPFLGGCLEWPIPGKENMYKKTHIPDEIDNRLLERVKNTPGLSIAQVIEPLLCERSEDRLRRRLKMLAVHGFVRFEKTKYRTFVYPMEGQR